MDTQGFNFYIDRQLGGTIFIKVQNGLVKDVAGETEKFLNRMKELYLDKEISFLKTDFEKRMKSTFHCVHSLDLANSQQTLSAINTRQRLLFNYISENKFDKYYNKEKAERLGGQLWEENKLEAEEKRKLEKIIEELKTVHRFNF